MRRGEAARDVGDRRLDRHPRALGGGGITSGRRLGRVGRLRFFVTIGLLQGRLRRLLQRRQLGGRPGPGADGLCGVQSIAGKDLGGRSIAITSNPKLNNVAKGYRAARSEWVVMTDSNLLLPPDYLRTLAATWQSDTGLVSSPPSGIRPGNFWGAVECAFLNTSQGRWQLAADSLGMGFAQGKTLFWNRKVLEAGGGLPALGRNLAEDVASTKLVRAQGLRVRLTPKLFPQPVGDRSARFVWDRQLRWSRVRRDGFPLIFMAEIAQGPLVPVAALVTLAALGTVPWILLPVLLLAWYGAEIALARVAGWPATPRDLAAMIVRDALLPALWLATWTGRGITWRGTDMAPAGTAGPAE